MSQELSGSRGCYIEPSFLYRIDFDTWISLNPESKSCKIGLTSVGQAFAGRLDRFIPKQIDSHILLGGSLGTIESRRYVGAVKSPLSCVVKLFNESVLRNPTLINDDPYGEGWIVEVTPSNFEVEKTSLKLGSEALDDFEARAAAQKVTCFKVTPEFEINTLGLMCPGPIVNLSDTIKTVEIGTVLHLMSDDPAAVKDVQSWARITGQEIVEFRREGPILHFIIRKLK